jgi:uncharacterized protein YeeX (DUF496 family)
MKNIDDKIEKAKSELKALELKKRVAERKGKKAMKQKRVSLLISISAYIFQQATPEKLAEIETSLKAGKQLRIVNYMRTSFSLPDLSPQGTEAEKEKAVSGSCYSSNSSN